MGVVSVWAVSGHTGAVIWHFALSSAPRDNLDTFVGASPRRGTGARKEILYVADEDGCVYALNASVAATSVTWWRTHRTLRLSQRRDGARRSGQHCEYGQRPSAAAQRVIARSFASALVLPVGMRKRFASRMASEMFNLFNLMSAFENVELPMTILGKLSKKVSHPPHGARLRCTALRRTQRGCRELYIVHIRNSSSNLP